MAYYIDILAQLGLTPESFVEDVINPIQNPSGQLIILTEKRRDSLCPRCHKNHIRIHDYYRRVLKVRVPYINEIKIEISRVRYECKDCGKSYVLPIQGLENKKQHTKQFDYYLLQQMREMKSFKQIARENDVSVSYVIKLFDISFSFFPRLTLPKILCIDEFYFSRKKMFKYCCVLTNYETGDIVDIIQSRQKSFLSIFFGAIDIKERSKVKYFVSDMYDNYAWVKERYFPNSTYIIDKFHYVKQMTSTLNKYRVFVMNSIPRRESKEYCFLKNCWKFFLCRTDDIYEKTKGKKFTCKYMNYEEDYEKMVINCLKLDPVFYSAYTALQDIFKRQKHKSYNDANLFLDFLIAKLRGTGEELFKTVADTYEKWRDPIANCITINGTGLSISNGIAEGTNNLIKTVLKVAYGYHSYSRFRFRALLILRSKK